MKIKRTIAITGLLIIVSCEYTYKTIEPVNKPKIVTLSGNVQPIFNNKCIACHNNTHPYLDLREGLSYDQLWTTGVHAPYVDTTNATSSLLYQKINSGSMSAYPSSSDKETILEWIEQGAKNN